MQEIPRKDDLERRREQVIATTPWRATILAIALLWVVLALPAPAEKPTETLGSEEAEQVRGGESADPVPPDDPDDPVAPDGSDATVDAETSATAPGDGEGGSIDRRSEIDRVVGDCWWNRPQVVSALTLETAQREQMDAVMKAYLEDLYAPRDEALRRNPFRVALKRGDLDEATRVLDERARLLAEETIREGRMMVAVLGHLSVEQREILGNKFPQVFRARWLMTFGAGERERRGATPPRARRRSVDGPGGMQ